MRSANEIGVLLVNLGTPEAPETAEVRHYLREFLSDPRVLDMHPIGRWALLNLIILPLRPARSAEAYQKIWMEEGSPLLVYGRRLLAGLREALPEYECELAMRYGKPSIASGIESLRAKGCERILVFPLYPQYASSTTGSTLERVYLEAAGAQNPPSLSSVPAFYEHPAFIDAFVAATREKLEHFGAEHLLLSYHGLPEHHLTKSGPGHCLQSENCCEQIGDQNRNCYRAQCFATSRALLSALAWEPKRATVAFQSRLGRTPWIRPYTDDALNELAERGIKRVAVLCPAFVADCLETLEEIGMRAEEDFRKKGGEALCLLPSLNDHPAWIEAVATIARESLPSASR